jgi:prophage antirepressor-like protein|nr:MAG TPA: antirepressor [Caudoviricetes sp.]
MSDIVVHTFRDQQVRTTMGPDGEPRFVLSDLCKALNLTNAAVAARRLSDSMKGVSQIYTPGGPRR